MGGWMTYGRFRARNSLAWRPDPERVSPYPEKSDDRLLFTPRCTNLIVGDLNRFERDCLVPVYPQPPWAVRPAGSDPVAVCARETGIDPDTVRAVLAHVFAQP